MKFSVIAFALICVMDYSCSRADNTDAHPVVPGFERFSAVAEVSDVERGQLLINELNCLACHAGQTGWSVTPKQAPILTGVGDRIVPEFLESYLLDPSGVKPGTTMPDVLAGKSKQERRQIAEALAHFLASTGQVNKQNSSSKFVAQGEQLFHQIGCVACHNPQNEAFLISTSIPLGQLSKKYTLPSLTEFLKNPMHVRPSGRMPQFNFSGTEAQSIAAYLLRDVVIDGRVNFKYYEGVWDKLPNFDELEAVASGIASEFDVNLGRSDRFGIVFSGYWETFQEAEYRFRLTSDDGSRLLINGQQLIDNDDIHGMVTKEGTLNLPAGIHEIEVQFFEKDGGEGLKVEVVGGGLEGVDLASLVRNTREVPKVPGVKEFKLDLQKAALGKQFFQSVGCANCHEMQIDGQQLVSTAAQPQQLQRLDVAAGCLAAESDAAAAPQYSLSDQQRISIVSALNKLDNAKSSSTNLAQSVHEKLLTLNCYACHSRESDDRTIRGGVIDKTGDSLEVFGRKKWFTSTQAEMGDEGQHPPYLKSIGAKFKPQWLRQVLENGDKVRPYMLTRMPKFGKQNLANLAEQLLNLDRLSEVVKVNRTESERQLKMHGRFFAGAEALACIKCHTFDNYPATGIQAMDLTTMAERLDKNWFHAYMLKPSRFRRGTRMPESWPGGQTFYKDILDGDVDRQIDALWAYLKDGQDARKPKGLLKSKQELIVGGTPMIYRNFIQGAGPRAIAVGYPEYVNVAFDAEKLRMALIWQENFIDAARHWSGRGQGFEPPLGENVISFANGPEFAMLANASSKWPGANGDPGNRKFMGYRFDQDRRPMFRYRVGDVEIVDLPIPRVEDDRPLLSRKFTITSDNQVQIWYRFAAAKKIETAAINTFKVDDRLTVQFSESVKPTVRQSQNQQELIVPIELGKGSVEFEIHYDW